MKYSISRPVLEVLANLPRDPSGFTFPMTPNAVTHAWNRVRERANLPNLHFKDLRHLGATDWVRRGIKTHELKHVQGHSTIATARFYVDLVGEDQLNALDLASDRGGVIQLPPSSPKDAQTQRNEKRALRLIHKRLPVWSQLTSLLEHAKDLDPYDEIAAEKEAIQTQRSLLAEPDAVRPLLDRTADLLRHALNAKLQGFTGAYAMQHAHLTADADWNKLSTEQSAKLTLAHHLEPLKAIDLATPDQLQDALDDCNLDHWISKTQALSSRFDAARHAAVQLLKPNVVHVNIPKRTLNNESELKAWLVEVEQLLTAKLKDGPVAL